MKQTDMLNLHLIQTGSHFFSVTSNEGSGAAFIQQLNDGRNLFVANAQLMGDLREIILVNHLAILRDVEEGMDL
jgi:hypothetical protein